MTCFIRRPFILVLLLGLLPAAAAFADDFHLSLALRHNAFYPPLKWVPIRIEIRNNTDRPLDGHVEMPIRGENVSVAIHVPVHVPARSRSIRTAYAYFPEEVATTVRQRKDQSVPPITTATLHTADGKVVAREELLAKPLLPSDSLQIQVTQTPATTLFLTDEFSDAPGADPGMFMPLAQRVGGYASVLASLGADGFPRHRAALDGVRLVLLGDANPDDLDPVQRDVLIKFIRAGGVLVVSAPRPEVADSWLGRHLPARLIGQRLGHEIRKDGKPVALVGHVAMAEALPADGQVVAADEHYVYAAWRPMGLGRIVFTSFPIGALPEGAAAEALWGELLRTSAVPRDWSLTSLPEQRDEVLSRLIGKSVAPWSLAAGVTGGYLLLVAGAQLVIGGPRRPRAFALTLGLAVLLSVGLVAAGLAMSQDQKPMAARLATLDLSDEGGGVIQEAVAFVGVHRDLALVAADTDITLRPMESFNREERTLLSQPPFAAPRTEMLPNSYQRVWWADGTLPAGMKLSATARFDAEGLKLRTVNGLGTALEWPRIVWGRTVLTLGEPLAVGESVRTAAATDNAMLVSMEDKLRQRILEASAERPTYVAQARSTQPMLVGFVGEEAVPRLLTTTVDEALVVRSQAMARVPLRIEPTPVGQTVRVPDRLMELRMAMGLPYDPNAGEWFSTRNDGPMVVGFAAPWRIGQIHPTRVTLNANLDTPAHRITLRPRGARDRQVVWENAVGGRSATIDLRPGDVGEDGVLWLDMLVETIAPQSGPMSPPWHIRWLRAELEGQVVGPPREPSERPRAPEPDFEPLRPAAAAKQNNVTKPAKQQDTKKPAAKQ